MFQRVPVLVTFPSGFSGVGSVHHSQPLLWYLSPRGGCFLALFFLSFFQPESVLHYLVPNVIGWVMVYHWSNNSSFPRKERIMFLAAQSPILWEENWRDAELSLGWEAKPPVARIHSSQADARRDVCACAYVCVCVRICVCAQDYACRGHIFSLLTMWVIDGLVDKSSCKSFRGVNLVPRSMHHYSCL